MENLIKYLESVKEQLYCNASEEYRNNYVTYMYSNEQIDANIDYFENCMRDDLSPYKALLFFYDFMEDYLKNATIELEEEKNEPKKDKQYCEKCGNGTFRVYIGIIIDDARLYCSKCGESVL